jgi:hypothetical protein
MMTTAIQKSKKMKEAGKATTGIAETNKEGGDWGGRSRLQGLALVVRRWNRARRKKIDVTAALATMHIKAIAGLAGLARVQRI